MESATLHCLGQMLAGEYGHLPEEFFNLQVAVATHAISQFLKAPGSLAFKFDGMGKKHIYIFHWNPLSQI